MVSSTHVSSITPSNLHVILQSGEAVVFDVRRADAFAANPIMIDGSTRLQPWLVPSHLAALKIKPSVVHRLVMVCVYGHAVSQTACAIAHCHGFEAAYLDGGLDAWCAEGLPIVSLTTQGAPHE